VGILKALLSTEQCRLSHPVHINVWNLSRCPVLVLFFILQQIHIPLQGVVVTAGVASFFHSNHSFLLSASAGMVCEPVSFPAVSAQSPVALCPAFVELG